jgi:ankyrin repeat protein
MNETFWETLRFRNIDTTNTLLDLGADINFRSDCYLDRTALLLCVHQGWSDLAHFLIQRGADVNISATNGGTPLLSAIADNDLPLIQSIIEHGAMINGEVNTCPPLHQAVYSNKIAIVDLLLKAGAAIDTKRSSRTAADEAAQSGHQAILHHLLGRGATPSISTAAAIGDIAAINQYIEAGGDINYRARYSCCAPLYVAAINNQLEVAQLLIQHNAKINVCCAQDNCALLAACHRASPEMVRLLLENGANIQSTDLFGGVILNAATGGNIEIMQLLFSEFGVEYSSKKSEDSFEHVFRSSAACGQLEMLEFLLAQGVSLPPLEEGMSLFDKTIYGAAIEGHYKVVEFLVKHGGNPNISSGRTALMYLVLAGNVSNASRLLQVGFDVNAKDEDRSTALHLAALIGDLEMVKLLVTAGADVNAVDRYGNTPLIRAACWRSDDVIDFLLANGARG